MSFKIPNSKETPDDVTTHRWSGKGMLEQQKKPDFSDDPVSLFNLRNRLMEYFRHGGNDVTGAGMGFGEADISVVVDCREYVITIRPVSN